MLNTPQSILKKYWGHEHFRPQQEDIIQAVLDNKDVLAILPTGGGKSVCFQVPALLKDGLCLVISPLIALMKDQVNNLEKKGIKAACIHSGMNYHEVRSLYQQLVHDNTIKLLYISPERLETKNFQEILPELNISMVAIDEAHCISQWGYDFRPPYLRIANTKILLKNIPFIALTASATAKVADDIIAKLQLHNPHVYKQSFAKPNLSFSVIKADSKINKIVEILDKVKGSAIIYCSNRKDTKEIAGLLRANNIHADYYHAGLSFEERTAKQDTWINNHTRVIVCTNAFGMGIDKPDVRMVIHYQSPDCLENYYQEAGRAGRDGKNAFAVLLYNDEDLLQLKLLPKLKYPSVDEIRKMYQQLCDYLQIDVGCGQGLYYDFNLMQFVKNFKLDVHLTLNALKILEQEDLISVSESIYIPAKIGFTANRQTLETVEKLYPELDETVKTLLRTYHGIFDNEVSVYEKQIAKQLRISTELLVQHLQRLQALNVLLYKPAIDTPQIYFNHNRIAANLLQLNHNLLQQRKQWYQERVEHMIAYIQNTKECRSRNLAAYFTDNTVNDCGICDNCLQRKAASITPEEFQAIENKIYQHAGLSDSSLNKLIYPLKRNEKAKTMEVLNFLIAEQKIKIDVSGNIRKNTH